MLVCVLPLSMVATQHIFLPPTAEKPGRKGHGIASAKYISSVAYILLQKSEKFDKIFLKKFAHNLSSVLC